ncbi:hypothetical protein [Nonomuraea soli]|uniref:Serine/threonine protein kinase n=1 Tax=Nonomuraea soli TaxID=1032476 RepID=A0A7W0CMP0_9ACTN|nr:hypothetical protein [Nonomuraea soli]MBA2894028.1 serine/threonine protein kinase [Nonomuraea soli]
METAHYTVIRRLGEGETFLAQSASGQLVALKYLTPEYTVGLRAWLPEARAVSSRHLAPILDADLDAERPWVATAYLEGPTLQEHGPVGGYLGELSSCLHEAVDALRQAGIAHGDLRPSNVILSTNGPRLVDYALTDRIDDADGLESVLAYAKGATAVEPYRPKRALLIVSAVTALFAAAAGATHPALWPDGEVCWAVGEETRRSHDIQDAWFLQQAKETDDTQLRLALENAARADASGDLLSPSTDYNDALARISDACER